MSRRVSAEELEQGYKLKHLLLDFTDAMKDAMYENLEEKGFSWRDDECFDEPSKAYLKRKLREHVKVGNWVSVANFAFMLHDKESKGEAETK